MTTYKIYYKDEFGTNFCWIEVADKVDGKVLSAAARVKAAKAKAAEEYCIKPENIIKVVKDC